MTREELKRDISNIIDNLSDEEIENLSIDGFATSLKEKQNMAEELIKINGEFKKLTKVVQKLENTNPRELTDSKPYINMYNFINDSIVIMHEMSNANYINIFKFNTQFGAFKKAYLTIARYYKNIMDEVGITPIAYAGEEYDPETQKVVEVVLDRGSEYIEIIDVVEQGFTYKGELIKYAKVSVSK